MGISRVEYDGELLIDISSDTVKKETLLKGETAHDSNGDKVVGECEYDMKTTDFTAFAEHIYYGKTAGVNKSEVTGTMPINDASEHIIAEKEGVFCIPQGYHDGNGSVKISPTEMSKLVPENIREGKTILGVTGTMTGNEGEKSQPKVEVAAPLKEDLTVLPGEGFTCLSEVVVKKVPCERTDKSADNKGTWVKIG